MVPYPKWYTNPLLFASLTMRNAGRIPLLFIALLLPLAASCRHESSSSDDAGVTAQDAADADTETDAGVALIDHDLWWPVSSGADPFDDRPESVDCDPKAFGTELIAPSETFFVKTQGCDYLTVTQPLAASIAQGDTVQVHAWHFDLTAPAASEAHLAVMIAGHTVWETYVPIPSDSELLVDTWTAPEEIAAGENIYFHVHNHGNNEYNLVEVSLQR